MTVAGTNHPQVQRVFLVDDNAIVRLGIKLLLHLEPDLAVGGEAEDAEEALVRIRSLRPDLAIVDLILKGSSGLELIPRLRQECPTLPVLVLSMHDQARWIESALLAGAQGYLTKEESPDRLIYAIRQLLAGRRYLSRRSLACLGEQAGRRWMSLGRIPEL